MLLRRRHSMLKMKQRLQCGTDRQTDRQRQCDEKTTSKRVKQHDSLTVSYVVGNVICLESSCLGKLLEVGEGHGGRWQARSMDLRTTSLFGFLHVQKELEVCWALPSSTVRQLDTNRHTSK